MLKLTDHSTMKNARSLLLRIPQEIKDYIYLLVCGGNLLHIEIASGLLDPGIKFRHSKCLSTKTEQDAQRSFDASTSPWFDEGSVNRHDECAPKFSGDVSGRISRRCTLDLRFLRTCRQIYDEAKSFCYTANTFSFDKWSVFGQFVNTEKWASYIRSVRLYARRGTNGHGPPNHEMLQSASKKLTGLQTFIFDWEQVCLSGSRMYDQRAEAATQLTKQLLCFAGAALKSVVVVISDEEFDPSSPGITQSSQDDALSQQLNRWTMKQKQEYSRFLRHAMIQHRGKDDHVTGETGDSRVLEVCLDKVVIR